MLFCVFLIATLFFHKGNDRCLLVVRALFFERQGNLLQKFIGDWCEGLIFIPNKIELGFAFRRQGNKGQITFLRAVNEVFKAKKDAKTFCSEHRTVKDNRKTNY